MQAKAQLVGIRERVSSDVGSNVSSNQSTKVSSDATGGSAKRVATATNPNVEDAADILRYSSYSSSSQVSTLLCWKLWVFFMVLYVLLLEIENGRVG